MPEPGLRERKKRETRELIARTAQRLFSERGFDAVTVEDVARAAAVSRKTVFNYFPAKEDLFFSGLEQFEAELLGAIRARAAGESILAAFARFVTDTSGLLASTDRRAVDRLYAVNRLIADSPALVAREQQIQTEYTDALAMLLAEELRARPDDVAPWVAANAMMGLHRALIAYVRGRILGGERDLSRLDRALRAQARRALPLLEDGLGRLGVESGTGCGR